MNSYFCGKKRPENKKKPLKTQTELFATVVCVTAGCVRRRQQQQPRRRRRCGRETDAV